MANQIKFQPVMGSTSFVNGLNKQSGQLIVDLDTGALYVVGPGTDKTPIPVGGVSEAVTAEINRVLTEIEGAEY